MEDLLQVQAVHTAVERQPAALLDICLGTLMLGLVPVLVLVPVGMDLEHMDLERMDLEHMDLAVVEPEDMHMVSMARMDLAAIMQPGPALGAPVSMPVQLIVGLRRTLPLMQLRWRELPYIRKQLRRRKVTPRNQSIQTPQHIQLQLQQHIHRHKLPPNQLHAVR